MIHMALVISAIVFCCAGLAVLALVAAISRRKKFAAGDMRLIGASALVDSVLDPEGAILVTGELWRARSADGRTIPTHTKVHVVDLQGHLLLVEPDDETFFS
jgi:membrane-bound ClpP family serine protease